MPINNLVRRSQNILLMRSIVAGVSSGGRWEQYAIGWEEIRKYATGWGYIAGTGENLGQW